MKKMIIFGGDRLGVIPYKLSNQGFEVLSHINGRKTNMVKVNIPEETDLVLVLTDYINHNVTNSIKKLANKKVIPVVYSRRSWSSIAKVLEEQ
ncbi:DUF2325 domain-containing protein [Halalkalibacter kiskunsagensis]|uniref:DUF2325 domain-containing protein n=1 Tax=Halalkalibacter kiskunsagensis TaxID=1548599 RepID=A0ABV6KH61_9BACI